MEKSIEYEYKFFYAIGCVAISIRENIYEEINMSKKI